MHKKFTRTCTEGKASGWIERVTGHAHTRDCLILHLWNDKLVSGYMYGKYAIAVSGCIWIGQVNIRICIVAMFPEHVSNSRIIYEMVRVVRFSLNHPEQIWSINSRLPYCYRNFIFHLIQFQSSYWIIHFSKLSFLPKYFRR